MTAQERAEQIGEYWTTDMGKGFFPPQAMINDIAAAIEAAVSEERERCAKEAESYDFIDPRYIAARIREPKRG